MENKQKTGSKVKFIVKTVLTVIIAILTPIVGFVLALGLLIDGYGELLAWLVVLIVPLILPLIWLKKRKLYLIGYVCFLLCFAVIFGIQSFIKWYKRMVTIDVTPNINVREYLPFDEYSKIIKLDSKILKFTENDDLPIIDGATAAFPVYSAFVNAVYPNTTTLYDDVFKYNNTVGGYEQLAKKKTDVFIGAPPSKDQIEYAKSLGTEFEYTQIGSEAFVFFVHKDNPIQSLTAEQIRGIYSGEITNWSEVGGEDRKIVAYQRDENSGSQSMLIRFMGDTPIMAAEKTTVSGMGGIIEKVADYESNPSSIGFSFRFYVEGMIKNPDIKVIAVDGVAPTVENIKNNTYSIVTPVYAVTYKGNTNENVAKLVNWMRSDEAQLIIEQTGYVGIK